MSKTKRAIEVLKKERPDLAECIEQTIKDRKSWTLKKKVIYRLTKIRERFDEDFKIVNALFIFKDRIENLKPGEEEKFLVLYNKKVDKNIKALIYMNVYRLGRSNMFVISKHWDIGPEAWWKAFVLTDRKQTYKFLKLQKWLKD